MGISLCLYLLCLRLLGCGLTLAGLVAAITTATTAAAVMEDDCGMLQLLTTRRRTAE